MAMQEEIMVINAMYTYVRVGRFNVPISKQEAEYLLFELDNHDDPYRIKKTEDGTGVVFIVPHERNMR